MDKWSPWTQTVLFCRIFRHHSIRWSMAHCITVQVKIISPFELFPYPKILPAKLTTPRPCPWAITLSTIHCRPTSLTRYYISNLCRRHNNNSYRQWSINHFKQTTIQLTSWLEKWRMKANGSKSTHHIHHVKRNMSPGSHQQCQTPSDRRGQVSRAAPRQNTHPA
jgi:hypothetical protein